MGDPMNDLALTYIHVRYHHPDQVNLLLSSYGARPARKKPDCRCVKRYFRRSAIGSVRIAPTVGSGRPRLWMTVCAGLSASGHSQAKTKAARSARARGSASMAWPQSYSAHRFGSTAAANKARPSDIGTSVS